MDQCTETTLVTTSVVVNCSGDEENILACAHSAASCGEDSSAGVICQGTHVCSGSKKNKIFQHVLLNSIKNIIWKLL